MTQPGLFDDMPAKVEVKPAKPARLGINGDSLAEGKLDLPELLEVPTIDDWVWARWFIVKRSWREAKTYRETAPHEYFVRDWDKTWAGQQAFEQFVTMIRRFGCAGFYYRVRHLYWTVDEYRYFTMGWPVNETTVINRAREDAPRPWERRA